MPTQPASSTRPSVRVIKKYPNRRLYDGEASRYITVAEVKDLVMKGEPFVVRDVKTNEDLTRSVLLQIILEEEAGGTPIFSEGALRNIIRYYGNTMQGYFGKHLERNVQAFIDMQAKLAESTAPLPGDAWAQMLNTTLNPMPAAMAALAEQYTQQYAKQSQAMMEQMREQMQKQTEQVLGAFVPKRGT